MHSGNLRFKVRKAKSLLRDRWGTSGDSRRRIRRKSMDINKVPGLNASGRKDPRGHSSAFVRP